MTSWLRHTLLIGATLLATLFVASCAQPDVIMPTEPEESEYIDVTICPSFDNGGATRVGKGLSIDKLFVEVYLDDDYKVGERLEYSVQSGVVEKISLQLINEQRYTIVFWAQNSSCNAYDITDLSDIVVDYTRSASFADVDKRDAFYSAISFTVTSQTAQQRVKLYRPFALLTVGTAVTNYNSTVPGQSSALGITNVATHFNAFTGTATTPETQSLSFDIDGTTIEEHSDYVMVGIAYLLPADDKSVDCTITTNANGTQSVKSITLPNIVANKHYKLLGTELIKY
jgi:hypothetical protein